jgi:putative ankyrin repeat protein
MSKYSTLYAATNMGTYEDFLEMYKEGEQYKKDVTGDTLLWTALCNTNDEERYKIVNFLINKGADVKFINKEGLSLFFPLFSYGRDDIVKTTILCKTLLEKGADITPLYKPHKTVMFKNIFNYDNVPEIEMIPLYELIFAQTGLQLLVKDKWGLTLLDFAKKVGRYIGVKYIEDYIKKYNLTSE